MNDLKSKQTETKATRWLVSGALALATLFGQAFSALAAIPPENECEAVRRDLTAVCGQSPTSCAITSKDQLAKALAFVHKAQDSDEQHGNQVESLLKKPATTHTVAELLAAMSRSCEPGGYYRVWKGVSQFLKANPAAAQETDLKKSVRVWSLKEVVHAPTLLSLSIRMSSVSSLVESGALKISDEALVELEKIRAALKTDSAKVTLQNAEALGSSSTSDGKLGTEKKDSGHAAQAWMTSLRDEYKTAAAYSKRWAQWVRSNLR